MLATRWDDFECRCVTEQERNVTKRNEWKKNGKNLQYKIYSVWRELATYSGDEGDEAGVGRDRKIVKRKDVEAVSLGERLSVSSRDELNSLV